MFCYKSIELGHCSLAYHDFSNEFIVQNKFTLTTPEFRSTFVHTIVVMAISCVQILTILPTVGSNEKEPSIDSHSKLKPI